jgi:predicted tellurium resistance membrane protein TerC
MIAKFRYLKPALSLILLVVGVKMLTAHWLKAWLGDSFNFVILGVILALLIGGVVTSLVVGAEDDEKKA